ncbi:DUF4397 domain-containing protein [Actinomycetospora sp. NBC_00405]|uniref:DUF4397 domain-containing protein n=1 Tax=Actinomycetospora sp. NBC_00405 TaxID=2975952 RepID=UPI002E210BE8
MIPTRRILTVVAAATLALSTSVALAGAAQAAEGDQPAQVSVVHGIPGQPVDVYVNGTETVSDFAPGTVAGPLELPAGTYDLAVRAAGAPASEAPLVAAEDAEVPAGANISVVAHLSEQGQPTLTPFVNDVGSLPAGDARLVVRHTAAAPAVDARVDGQAALSGLTNPNSAQADVPAGTVSADVVLAGTDDVVIGPASLELGEGTVNIAYAIGSASDDTLQLVTQTITGAHSAPGGVAGGSGGLADDGLPVGLGLGVLGLLVLAGSGAAWVRARS